MTETASMCDKEISSILAPAEQWVTQINNASAYLNEDDISNCRTQLSGVISSVENSINEFAMLLCSVEYNSSYISDILFYPDDTFSPPQGGTDMANLSTLRSLLRNCSDSLNLFNGFCNVILSNLKTLQTTLNIGVAPYDYNSFQSPVVARMQITSCLKTISDLRAIFF
ncbi:hypothetical protein [Pseudomonas sp. QD4]|uniref:hypothetical protein n=1 Tax=Pseudomonas sp. QD4 TaxID=3368618 RepID=UPI003B9F5B5C